MHRAVQCSNGNICDGCIQCFFGFSWRCVVLFCTHCTRPLTAQQLPHTTCISATCTGDATTTVKKREKVGRGRRRRKGETRLGRRKEENTPHKARQQQAATECWRVGLAGCMETWVGSGTGDAGSRVDKAGHAVPVPLGHRYSTPHTPWATHTITGQRPRCHYTNVNNPPPRPAAQCRGRQARCLRYGGQCVGRTAQMRSATFMGISSIWVL